MKTTHNLVITLLCRKQYLAEWQRRPRLGNFQMFCVKHLLPRSVAATFRPSFLQSIITLTLLLFGLLQMPAHGAGNTFQLLKELPVGDSSGWNVFCLDEPTRRLYAVTGSNIFVVDLDTEQVVEQFTNVVGIRDFAVLPHLREAFYIQGQEPKVHTVDLNTFRHRFDIKTGDHPEAVLVPSDTSLAYSLNTGDQTTTIFETDDGDYMGNVSLPGAPRSAVFDPQSRRVLFAIPDKREIAVMNPMRRNEITTLPVSPGEQPSALVLEPKFRWLLAGCGNNKLVMLDIFSGRVMNAVAVDSGANQLVYDPSAKLVFAAGDKDVISIVHLDSPQKLTVNGTLNVPSGIKCMAVDSRTHKLYVGGSDSKIRVYGN